MRVFACFIHDHNYTTTHTPLNSYSPGISRRERNSTLDLERETRTIWGRIYHDFKQNEAKFLPGRTQHVADFQRYIDIPDRPVHQPCATLDVTDRARQRCTPVIGPACDHRAHALIADARGQGETQCPRSAGRGSHADLACVAQAPPEGGV